MVKLLNAKEDLKDLGAFMVKFPKGEILHCRNKKEGLGYKQECLCAAFRIYVNGDIVCDTCGTVYTNDQLRAINSITCDSCIKKQNCFFGEQHKVCDLYKGK